MDSVGFAGTYDFFYLHMSLGQTWRLMDPFFRKKGDFR